MTGIWLFVKLDWSHSNYTSAACTAQKLKFILNVSFVYLSNSAGKCQFVQIYSNNLKRKHVWFNERNNNLYVLNDPMGKK